MMYVHALNFHRQVVGAFPGAARTHGFEYPREQGALLAAHLDGGVELDSAWIVTCEGVTLSAGL